MPALALLPVQPANTVVRAHRIHPATALPLKNDTVHVAPWTGLTDVTYNYQDPTREMLDDPMWQAIWDEIKGWVVAWPTDPNDGPCTAAHGSHVTAIYLAIKNRERADAARAEEPEVAAR